MPSSIKEEGANMTDTLEKPTDTTRKGTYNRLDLPREGYVRLPAILNVIPVGKATWWKGVKNRRFPQPVRLGPRTTAWRAEDIWKLIESYRSDG